MTRHAIGSGVRVAILSLLVVVPAGPAIAQSPLPSPASSVELVVPVVGPDALGPAPSPPIGPEWRLTLEVPSIGGYGAKVAVCGDWFTLMASGRDRKDRRRARLWTSPDGSTWTRAGVLRPTPGTDPYWLVTDLVVFKGGLFAVGGDDRRLAVWRSADCGRTWRRLRDPSFELGRDAFGLSHGAEVAVTADRMLVVAHQGGEEIPNRQWAWIRDAGGDWRRIRGGLDASVGSLVGATDDGFFAVDGGSSDPDGARLVTSRDGESWSTLGRLPDYGFATLDPAGPRFLSVNQEPHDADAVAPLLWASSDAQTWSELAVGMPSAVTFGSVAAVGEGLIVWVADAGTDEALWSWIGVSEDDGVTWAVSAGWPRLAQEGRKSIAIGDDAIVIAGGQSHGTHVWTLPR